MLDAATADFFIVGATGDRRFIVERDADGVSITPTPTIDATRKQYAVKLDGVKVGEDAAFGGDGAMEPARVARLHRARRRARPGSRSARWRWRSSTPRSASSSAGRSAPTRRSRTAARRCCSRPRAPARPSYYAAWAADNEPETAPLAASMAKAYASDAGTRVTGASLQVHGGIGFTWEHDLHLWLKRAQLATR